MNKNSSNDVEQEAPYYDKHGREIKEFAVLKVFHFTGARKKKHYMYKWVRLIEDKGKKYWYAQHLNDNTAFFEKGSDKWLTGYGLRAVANPERKIMDTEIVQQYDE
jgi:nuclear transport factor 2 (NTF2) superfamily protein